MPQSSGTLLRSNRAPLPKVDSRAFDRYSCVLEASCHPSDDVEYNPGWPARVRDISRGGVSLYVAENFAPGSLLVIGMESTTQSFIPPFRVRIVHATLRKDGYWLLGCAFLRPLSEEELEGML